MMQVYNEAQKAACLGNFFRCLKITADNKLNFFTKGLPEY